MEAHHPSLPAHDVTAAFDVVILVMSAGGLDAISRVLRDLPSDFPAAVVVMQQPHAPGARILVVDDNTDMREYLRRLLAERWRIDVAGDGEQALASMRTNRPDLVVADVMMPNLDGFAMLRAVRADEALRHTPVVIVTVRAGEDAAIEGLMAGADDYIAKPFSGKPAWNLP